MRTSFMRLHWHLYTEWRVCRSKRRESAVNLPELGKLDKLLCKVRCAQEEAWICASFSKIIHTRLTRVADPWRMFGGNQVTHHHSLSG
jgi:hypothetical protein